MTHLAKETSNKKSGGGWWIKFEKKKGVSNVGGFHKIGGLGTLSTKTLLIFFFRKFGKLKSPSPLYKGGGPTMSRLSFCYTGLCTERSAKEERLAG